MLTEVLTELYERDLNKLRDEISAYENEADLWRSVGGISNSAGNLCLHLTGNLRHFIGAILGNTGYVRDRDAEFANKGVTRDEMLAEIEATIAEVRTTLSSLTADDLAATYPLEVFGRPMTTEFFLTHLTTHFNYHLGQLNYHRRILANS